MIAESLFEHQGVGKMFYPGLSSHENHEIARRQMSGYGGIVSFELNSQNADTFMRKLTLIKPALSLGGVESTICDPSTTSHRHLTKEQKAKEGISDRLLRLSVGIEDVNDLIVDLHNALKINI